MFLRFESKDTRPSQPTSPYIIRHCLKGKCSCMSIIVLRSNRFLSSTMQRQKKRCEKRRASRLRDSKWW